MLVLYFVIFLGFNLFYTAFPMRAAVDLGWTVTDTGIFFAVLSGAMVIVQGPVLGRLSRLFSDAQLIVAGSLILATNFVFLISRETVAVYASAILFAVGNGVMWPSVLSLLSKLAGSRFQGAGLIYLTSAMALPLLGTARKPDR
jgi:hypothetical protein